MRKNKNVIIFLIVCIVILIALILSINYFKRNEKVSGKILPFEEVDLGYLTVYNPGQFVINSEDQLKELLNNSNQMMSLNGSDINISGIDFNKNTLIVIFMGEMPTSGYSIEIDVVSEEENYINLYYKEITPGKDCIVNQVITYPYKAIKIPITSKKVKFQPMRIVENCD